MSRRDARLSAFAAFVCLVGAAAVILFALASSSRARAEALGYVIEIDGEQHVILNAEAQARLVAALRTKDAEIAALRATLTDKRKAECNLI